MSDVWQTLDAPVSVKNVLEHETMKPLNDVCRLLHSFLWFSEFKCMVAQLPILVSSCVISSSFSRFSFKEMRENLFLIFEKRFKSSFKFVSHTYLKCPVLFSIDLPNCHVDLYRSQEEDFWQELWLMGDPHWSRGGA